MQSNRVKLDVVRAALFLCMAPGPVKRKNDVASSTKFFASSCPLPPWQFELTRLYKMVCSDPSASLIHYLYHPNPPWHYEADAVKSLWDLSTVNKAVPRRKQKTLSVLCYLALQNYRSGLASNKPAHKISRLIEISGVSASNWRRDWLPWWRLFSEQAANIDNDALLRLSWFISNKD